VTPAHWRVLLIYFAFTLAATALALARRWLRPGAGGESVWSKYPSYLLLNLMFLIASWLPHAWHALTALLTALGGLAAWEITRALWPQARALPLATIALVAAGGWLSQEGWLKAWLATLLAGIAANTWLGPRGDLGRRALALAGSLVYVPLCLAAYLWTWQADSTGFRVVFLYLTVATNDALAQITGQLFGARQLAPHLSPAKTVEGALGGVLLAGAMGAAMSGVAGWSLPVGAVLGLVMGMAGLMGDLTASAWKRALGLKNFSDLLGAQGGVLDRFDGLLFAAPVFYLLTVWR